MYSDVNPIQVLILKDHPLIQDILNDKELLKHYDDHLKHNFSIHCWYEDSLSDLDVNIRNFRIIILGVIQAHTTIGFTLAKSSQGITLYFSKHQAAFPYEISFLDFFTEYNRLLRKQKLSYARL